MSNQEIHAAHEAATWYLRREDGLSKAEFEHYFHWLKESPENVQAMLFFEQFWLRTGRTRITRH